MSEKHPEAPRIMIVDDAPQNLELLEFMLLAQGYQVFALPNGEMALKAAAKTRPAMILLDILMPGLDGYEVCRRLKADPHLQDIPVLFLSALNEPLDKARAFQVGGVDYITKPFQLVEIEARVRTHLQLHRQSRELQTNYERLRELEQLRDGLVHMMVHDMRSPLAALTIAAEAMGDALSKTDPYLVEMVTVARQSTQTLCRMASNLLDISRLESSQMPLHPNTSNGPSSTPLRPRGLNLSRNTGPHRNHSTGRLHSNSSPAPLPSRSTRTPLAATMSTDRVGSLQ